MIEINKNYYYTGTNIKQWQNKIIKVIEKLNYKMGTYKDVSVYLCEDENLIRKNIIECNLSLNPIEYNYSYGGIQECFPKDVKRFPIFKNGRYIYEYTWGKY